MPHCSQCKKEIKCPDASGYGHQRVDEAVVPCPQMCSIWVRAVDEDGAPVPGLSARADGKSDVTRDSGFAKLENLTVGKHTVKLALGGLALTDYQPLAKSTRYERLTTGDLKLIIVTVKSRITPVMTISAPAVAVRGKTATITLSTDKAYNGKGTFTCTKGADKLAFTPALNGGTLEIASVSGPQTVTVKARNDASDLDGILFEWSIDPAVQKGRAATGTMTVVKAELKVYKKSGPALSRSEKDGDGRTIHLQKPGRKWTRAKTEIQVLPAEYVGHVWLTATQSKVELYKTAEDGAAEDLSAKVAVGPGRKLEYYVSGAALSASKADTALEVKIDELSDVAADSCNFTVMETTLQICAPRVDANTEPAAIPDDQKFTVGRKLFKHRTKQTGQRALLRVIKAPFDAPCKLHLRAPAGADKISYFEATGERTHIDPSTSLSVTGTHSNENPVEGVAGKAFPREIAPDEVQDLIAASYHPDYKHLHQGLVFWLEGKAVGTALETKLQVDAEEVDDLCDTVACTVARPKLTIELIWKDPQPATADADVDFTLTAPGTDAALLTGQVKYATRTVSLDVDAGFYGIALTPHVSQKERRIMRLEPTDSETSLAVFADTTVKYELLPPYEKIQCIAYFMRTGAYVGVDAAVSGATDADDLRSKKRLQALGDIDGRCAVMKDAVTKAYGATGVLATDEKVLKIFMAPEFYFRGKQGAYPLETMSEILTPPPTPVKANIQALKTELDDTKYKDWLFVLGSAIGAIEIDADPQRTVVSGRIVRVEPKVACDVWVDNPGPATAVAAGWRLYAGDSGQSYAAAGVANIETRGAYTRYRLEFAADLQFSPKLPVALGRHGLDTVTFVRQSAWIKIKSTTPPKINGYVNQGATSAKILEKSALGGTGYKLKIRVPIDRYLTTGPASLVDGTNVTSMDIRAILKSTVVVDHGAGSVAGNAAAQWRFWNESAGVPPFPVAGNRSWVVDRTQTLRATRKAIVFSEVIGLKSTETLAVGDLYPVGELVSEKLVTVDVQFTGPVTIAKGQFFEMGGAAKGLVESSTDLGLNKHQIAIWLPLERPRGLAVNRAVSFSTPGNAEILNVALVRKGGTGTPVRADGGAQKELLVYKESISSVDFEGMDYSRGAYYRDDHQAIKLYGDPARKAKPTLGAAGSAEPSVSGQATPDTHTRISEINRSGLGGGSIFTMDGITFGLEVCLDHGEQKLVAYYKGLPSASPPIVAAAQPGEPKIQVQLIPACGKGIDDDAKCTVADGIVFNVDAYEYGCQKNGGGAAANEVGDLPLTPPSAATYFDTTDTAQSGFIKVFEALDKPTKEFV